jgi:hypothetical protein
MAVETTLRDLYIRDARDSLNLSRQPFLLSSTVNPNTQETIYLGLLPHLLAGTHFTDVLNLVTPNKSNVDAIVGDFNEAKRSHRKVVGQAENGTYLDTIHRGSDRIGPTFIDFYHNHMNRWKRALVNTEYDDLFNTRHNLIFTYNNPAFLDQLIDQWRFFYSGDSNAKFMWDSDISSNLEGYREPHFLAFLRSHSDFQKGYRGNVQEFDDPRTQRRFDHIHSRRDLDRRNFYYEFSELLSQEELRKLMAYKLTERVFGVNSTLVDLHNQEIVAGSEASVDFTFESHSLIRLRADSSEILVRATLETKSGFKNEILEYDLAKPKGHVIYPLVAWGNKEGQRRFLSQAEALPYLTQVGLGGYHYQADVVAGRLLMALYWPSVTRRWPTEIALQKPDGTPTKKQEIGGAQAGVWLSLPEHASQILAVPSFQTMENAA